MQGLNLLRKYTLLIVISIVFLSNKSTAQKVRFYASSDAKEIFSGSYFKVKFVIENANAKQFKNPDFDGFKVISGPNISSFYNMTNGSSSSKEEYNFTLLALNPGIYKIKSAEIIANGKLLKTKPIEIKVVKKSGNKSKSDNSTNKKFFIKSELSDSIAYPGQQVTLNYKLYTTVDISNYSIRYESDYNGFLTRILDMDNDQERIIVDNQEYYVFTLKTVALFPQKTGILKIDPINIVLHVPDKRTRNPFFSSTKPYPVTGNKLNLKVIPLPDNTPNDFSGNVGKFNIRIKIKRKKISTDDALSLLTIIEGNSSVKYIDAPDLSKSLSEFEIYDPKTIKQNEFIQNGKLYSKKLFEYLLVPKKKGNYSIKIPFTYFDTDSSKYITIYSHQSNITVTQGKNTRKTDSKSIISKYKLKPPSNNLTIHKIKKPFFGSITYWTLLILMMLATPAMYFYRRYLIKIGNIDPALLKRKKAGKEAIKRLKKAKGFMQSNEQSLFYKEISDALLKYIADKLNIPTIDLTKENVKSKLQTLDFSSDNTEEFIKLLETCEIALYASSPDNDMQRVYNKTVELITKMELNL